MGMNPTPELEAVTTPDSGNPFIFLEKLWARIRFDRAWTIRYRW
jgi:hypothetical protein